MGPVEDRNDDEDDAATALDTSGNFSGDDNDELMFGDLDGVDSGRSAVAASPMMSRAPAPAPAPASASARRVDVVPESSPTAVAAVEEDQGDGLFDPFFGQKFTFRGAPQPRRRTGEMFAQTSRGGEPDIRSRTSLPRRDSVASETKVPSSVTSERPGASNGIPIPVSGAPPVGSNSVTSTVAGFSPVGDSARRTMSVDGAAAGSTPKPRSGLSFSLAVHRVGSAEKGLSAEELQKVEEKRRSLGL